MSVINVLRAAATAPRIEEPYDNTSEISSTNGSIESSSLIGHTIANYAERILSLGVPAQIPAYGDSGYFLASSFILKGMQQAHAYENRIGRESAQKHTRHSCLVALVVTATLALLNMVLKVVRCVVHLGQAAFFACQAHKHQKNLLHNQARGVRDMAYFKLGEALGDFGGIFLEIGRVVYTGSHYLKGLKDPPKAKAITKSPTWARLLSLPAPQID